MNIGIYIYENAEVLDFSGPFEVFSTANRFLPNENHVFFIGQTSQTISARGGFNIVPHFTFADHPKLDLLIVVGGIHDQEIKKTAVIEWLSHQNESVKYIASVCTGAFLLAEAGVLKGLEVTTHWEDIDTLAKRYPEVTVMPNVRWVEQGRVFTSGGISAGIDMSLYLVEKLFSHNIALKTAKQMEFRWQAKAY
ncbi:DJ-1/PfpI family protein [Thalassotalea castellviae]|uniref:DJ-1/PfpI family protein n=1 Tax=Thalassotalea castellviae TaxID=3075612 RepID=A0ABU3A6Q9_9GAMM|nr:DJ-1/PfpI family protein [Thalassotalea sp. W431]MDT0605237.1 DJ-1/PfpI family protein [Thalassotalea sp. W431]